MAQLVLGEVNTESTIGGVSLQPHQLSAVSRLESALEEFGGALLCDEVGMGKTFVATGVARKYTRPLVVAPAALTAMWRQSLELTGITAAFVSFEKLSRIDSRRPNPRLVSAVAAVSPDDDHDLVIIDEAHHARNSNTQRYGRIQRLTRNAKVLLLTATPIHNRREEMSTLLSLFLGSRAKRLTPPELARCTIRR
jgi:superfamily II DNA or RNA helicase